MTEKDDRPKDSRGLERVEYALALGLDQPSDPADGFGWRVPDQGFWERWRADKEAMKAAGYRVTRGDEGQWLVSFQPKPRAHQKRMSESTHHIVVDEHGPPCPRCDRPMQVHEHDGIREKQLRGPFYYSRWYYCMNPDCLTNVVHDDRFKVFNNNPRPAKPEPTPKPGQVIWGDSWDANRPAMVKDFVARAIRRGVQSDDGVALVTVDP